MVNLAQFFDKMMNLNDGAGIEEAQNLRLRDKTRNTQHESGASHPI
jgi:hypothetical protein